jgi:hypothetical protein
MRHWFCQISLIAALSAFLARDAAPQSPPVYLQLSPTVKAVLYTPDASVKARVAVVNMHEDGNRLNDIACTELVKRGFYALCMNAARTTTKRWTIGTTCRSTSPPASNI